MKNRIIFILLSTISSATIYGQQLHDIERYFLSPIFNSNAEGKIYQLIEKDENSKTTRKWEFNKKGLVVNELDWRGSQWSTSFGGQTINSSSITYKEMRYEYHANDEISASYEMEIIDGDTLKTIHNFDYSKDNEVTETFRTKQNEYLDFEVIRITKSKSGLRDTTINYFLSHIGEGYVETMTKEVFVYDSYNILKSIKSYFSVNTYPLINDSKPEPEQIGSESFYSYDKFGRITEIYTNEFDEQGGKKLHRKLSFIYKRKKSKVIEVNVMFGEMITPKELTYKIKYRFNGFVRKVKFNDKTYFYTTKKRI